MPEPTQPTTTEPRTFTEDEVSGALNAACDEIIDAADLPDVGARDALNLLVNAAMSHLRNGTVGDLESVVASNYGDDVTLNHVLAWIGGGEYVSEEDKEQQDAAELHPNSSLHRVLPG
jgi:hypothetical protein